MSVNLTESCLLEAHVDGYIDLARKYVFGPVVACTMVVDFHDPAIPAPKAQLRVHDPQLTVLASEE